MPQLFEEVGTIRNHRTFLLQRLMVLRGPWRLEDGEVVEDAKGRIPGIWLLGDSTAPELVSGHNDHDPDALLDYYRRVESSAFELNCVVRGATLGHVRGERIIHYPAIPAAKSKTA